jgi:hypothetical protein
LPDAIKNVINLSVSPDAKLDGLAQLEQSFTHFRLRAPLLHIRLKIGATATKPWVASEAEPGFRLEAGFVEHAQALWIRPEDALKLGIARCLRKLFEAHRR